jgi:hypothetical protein
MMAGGNDLRMTILKAFQKVPNITQEGRGQQIREIGPSVLFEIGDAIIVLQP